MPEIKQPPYVQEPDLMQEPYKGAGDTFDDAYALTLVKQTFYQFESWRMRNHDARWRSSDTLYFGATPRRNWPGTSVPRAALGIPISFEQVDTAVSIIQQQLFGMGKEWFQVGADPGARIEDARQVEEHFRYLFRHGKNLYGHSVEVEFEQVAQSVCQYGNGACKVTWDATMQRPQIEYVDLRDLYIDPRTPSANLNDSRAVIEVQRKTVDELDAMRGDPRIKIPSREVLMGLSQMQTTHAGDQAVRTQESYRRIDYQPGASDNIPMPSDGLIELVIYTSRSRIIWVLNRMIAVYNQPNPYGVINYFMAPCYLVLKRALAMSIPETLEGNQMFIQGIMSGHLDEINLHLYPPRSRTRGGTMTASQRAWGPGTVNEYAHPKDDVVIHQPTGVLSNIYQTLSYLDASSDKRTGINSTLAGAPRGSNLFRTTAGVEVASRPMRLSRIMKHIENYILIPVLYFCYLMIRYHRNMDENMQGVAQDGGFTTVSTTAFLAPINISMHAASDMLQREQVLQTIPVIAQTLFAPQAQEAMNKMGLAGDYAEFLEMVQFATGTKSHFRLVRPLSDEEKQALNQPNPDAQIKMAIAQQDAQTRLQMGEMKSQIEQMKAQLEHDADIQETEERSAREITKIVMELMQAANPAEAQAKLQMLVAQGQQKIQQQDQMHRMKMTQQRDATSQKIQMGRMQMADKMQQASQGMQVRQAEAVQKMQIAEDQARQKAKMQRFAPKRSSSPRKPRASE